MKKTLLFFTTVLLFGLSTSFAQTIKVESFGVSPYDIVQDSIDQYFDRTFTGLQNVGKGTKVFLKGTSDVAFANPQWSFIQRPGGSAATFGAVKDIDTSGQYITFVADVVGMYKIALTDGAAADTLIINAALYLGVEGGFASCKQCHNNINFNFVYDKWVQTDHATMLQRGLDGTLSSHYGENCISCHTVGYDPDAANDGFDDFPFVFPDSLYPGVYNQMVSQYPDAMGRANIQCESCHGPGSNHYSLVDNKEIDATLNYKICAYCHDDGHYHVYPTQWEHSGEDATDFDGRGFHGGHARGEFVAYAGNRNGCSPCHSGSGYVQWIKEGRPVNSIGLPTGTSTIPPATNISCAVCHDPHDDENVHQLRAADTQLGDGTPITIALYGTGTQCMDCHRSRRYAFEYASDILNASSHYGAHHGPQADMLLGANAPDYGITFPTSPHGLLGNACVDCHMADTDNYKVGGHSFNMNDADGNDHVEACAPCHGNVGQTFKEKKYYINGNADHDGDGVSEGLQLEVHGLMEYLSEFLPHDANGNVAIVANNADSLDLTPEIMRAGYVYLWIYEDRSFGIHNPAFTLGLLKAAITEMGGVVSIGDIEDGVPQDYALSQNYPNPFNPSTTIEFSVPVQSNVKLVIFDAIGNQLDVLTNEVKAQGNYSVVWDASKYASGIYFYKLEADNFVQVRKMVLIK